MVHRYGPVLKYSIPIAKTEWTPEWNLQVWYVYGKKKSVDASNNFHEKRIWFKLFAFAVGLACSWVSIFLKCVE
jgi:hypothetical protein